MASIIPVGPNGPYEFGFLSQLIEIHFAGIPTGPTGPVPPFSYDFKFDATFEWGFAIPGASIIFADPGSIQLALATYASNAQVPFLNNDGTMNIGTPLNIVYSSAIQTYGIINQQGGFQDGYLPPGGDSLSISGTVLGSTPDTNVQLFLLVIPTDDIINSAGPIWWSWVCNAFNIPPGSQFQDHTLAPSSITKSQPMSPYAQVYDPTTQEPAAANLVPPFSDLGDLGAMISPSSNVALPDFEVSAGGTGSFGYYLYPPVQPIIVANPQLNGNRETFAVQALSVRAGFTGTDGGVKEAYGVGAAIGPFTLAYANALAAQYNASINKLAQTYFASAAATGPTGGVWTPSILGPTAAFKVPPDNTASIFPPGKFFDFDPSTIFLEAVAGQFGAAGQVFITGTGPTGPTGCSDPTGVPNLTAGGAPVAVTGGYGLNYSGN